MARGTRVDGPVPKQYTEDARPRQDSNLREARGTSNRLHSSTGKHNQSRSACHTAARTVETRKTKGFRGFIK